MIDKVHKIIQSAADVLGKENITVTIDTTEQKDIYYIEVYYTSTNLDNEFKVTVSKEKIYTFTHRYTYDTKCLLMVDMPRVDGQEGNLPYYTVFLKDFEDSRRGVTQFCEALKEYEKRYI